MRKLAAGEVEDDSADLSELFCLDDPDAVIVVAVPTIPKKKRKRTKKAKWRGVAEVADCPPFGREAASRRDGYNPDWFNFGLQVQG